MIRFEQDPSSLAYLSVNGQEHALHHRPLRLALPQIWQEKGFNPIRTLHHVTGPLIEIGGPTPYRPHYDSLPYFLLLTYFRPRLIIININRTTPTIKQTPLAIDVQADGRLLPFANHSAAGVFMHCLGGMEEFAPEAMRVLNPGGLFGVFPADQDTIDYYQSFGFNTVAYTWSREILYQRFGGWIIVDNINALFQKPLP